MIRRKEGGDDQQEDRPGLQHHAETAAIAVGGHN
jgi:hypothetical protein